MTFEKVYKNSIKKYKGTLTYYFKNYNLVLKNLSTDLLLSQGNCNLSLLCASPYNGCLIPTGKNQE